MAGYLMLLRTSELSAADDHRVYTVYCLEGQQDAFYAGAGGRRKQPEVDTVDVRLTYSKDDEGR